MQAESAGSQQLLKVINRMALVRHLCANPGLSRADLAGAVGLTKSTVSGLVRELIGEGWLVEREVVATGDLGRRPRPSSSTLTACCCWVPRWAWNRCASWPPR